MTLRHIIPTIHPAALLHSGKPLSDIIRLDLAKANRVSFEGYNHPENFVICHPSNPSGLEYTVRQALCWIERWIGLGCPVAVDVETSSLNFFNCKLYSISLAGGDGLDTAVAWTLFDLKTLPWDAEFALNNALRRLLESPKTTTVYHNAPYDYAVLVKKGFRIVGPIEDTMGYAHLIQPDVPKDLGWVGHTYTDAEPWKLSHAGEKLAFTKDVVELLVYNAKDALNTMKLRNRMLQEVLDLGMSTTLISYQMAFSRLAANMEIVGLPVNWEKRKQMGDAILAELKKMKAQMREYLNWPDFNPLSKAHAITALYDRKYIGLMPTAYTEITKEPSTKYESIIDHMEHPFVKCFVEYIENHHVYATQYRDPPSIKTKKGPKAGAYYRAAQADGRIHPKINPTGTKGSRQSTSPNCFDAKTEVLTEFGWMPWPEAFSMTPSPRIMEYIRETDSAKLVNATFCKTDKQAGESIGTIFTNQLDIRATLDHRMLVEYTKSQNKKWIKVEQVTSLESLTAKHWHESTLRINVGPTHNKAKFSRKDTTVEVLQKDEAFYCATVPSGFLFTRRNGKIVIAGNCQNQRKKDRAFFEAPPGRVIVGSDKSALELRIAACLAGVRELIEEMAKPGGDVHRYAALHVFGDAFLQKNAVDQKKLRNAVKTTVYASLYRAGIITVHKTIRRNKKLSADLRAIMTLAAVSHIYHSYFGKFVEFNIWHDKNYASVEQCGYIEIPPFGRRRYFPVLPPPFTEISSWKVQTLGSDVVTMQMVEIQDELNRRFDDAWIILHGHDAVYIECYERDAEAIKQLVEQIFGHYILEGPAGSVDLTAEARIGKSLMDAA